MTITDAANRATRAEILQQLPGDRGTAVIRSAVPETSGVRLQLGYPGQSCQALLRGATLDVHAAERAVHVVGRPILLRIMVSAAGVECSLQGIRMGVPARAALSLEAALMLVSDVHCAVLVHSDERPHA